MAGSFYGNIFRISTWGESHGKGVGVTIDGCPSGISLCEEDIQRIWTDENQDVLLFPPPEMKPTRSKFFLVCSKVRLQALQFL